MLRKAIVTAQGLADPAVRKSIAQDSANPILFSGYGVSVLPNFFSDLKISHQSLFHRNVFVNLLKLLTRKVG